MLKNLVSIGCSWPSGEELSDNHRSLAYPSLVAEHYGLALEDLSWNGASLESMEMSLRAWIANATPKQLKESVILMSLTNEARIIMSENDKKPNMSKDPSWITKNFEKYTKLYEEIAAEHGLQLIQFKVLTQNFKMKLPTLIESISALEMLVIRNKKRKDPVFCENFHPNEKGHLILSDFLINQLDSVIIDV